MKTLLNLFTRRKPSIYSTRIFEIQTWRDHAVKEAIRKQEMDIELNTNPNIKEQ